MGGLLSVNHLTGEHAMRLLILGATGGTGRALIRQARERGHEVTAFVRSPQKLCSLIFEAEDSDVGVAERVPERHTLGTA